MSISEITQDIQDDIKTTKYLVPEFVHNNMEFLKINLNYMDKATFKN